MEFNIWLCSVCESTDINFPYQCFVFQSYMKKSIYFLSMVGLCGPLSLAVEILITLSYVFLQKASCFLTLFGKGMFHFYTHVSKHSKHNYSTVNEKNQ